MRSICLEFSAFRYRAHWHSRFMCDASHGTVACAVAECKSAPSRSVSDSIQLTLGLKGTDLRICGGCHAKAHRQAVASAEQNEHEQDLKAEEEHQLLSEACEMAGQHVSLLEHCVQLKNQVAMLEAQVANATRREKTHAKQAA